MGQACFLQATGIQPGNMPGKPRPKNKTKKIRPGDIVGAICEIEGVCGDDIGVIQVQDYQSYVDILHGKGLQVLRALRQKTIKGKKLKVERAKE